MWGVATVERSGTARESCFSRGMPGSYERRDPAQSSGHCQWGWRLRHDSCETGWERIESRHGERQWWIDDFPESSIIISATFGRGRRSGWHYRSFVWCFTQRVGRGNGGKTSPRSGYMGGSGSWSTEGVCETFPGTARRPEHAGCINSHFGRLTIAYRLDNTSNLSRNHFLNSFVPSQSHFTELLRHITCKIQNSTEISLQ